MTIGFYGHPFSSYCQKVLIAFYENDIAFEWHQITFDDPDNLAEFATLWPIQKMPVLVDDGETVIESTIAIEYLDLYHPGPVRMVPSDPKRALEARFMDRFFDNYVMTPQGQIVFNAIRNADKRDPYGVEQSRKLLNTAYGWLDDRMKDRTWAIGDEFSLADCAAAPSLFYADWTHPIDPKFKSVHAYRKRLLERPSFARCVDDARPYRDLFPLGAPDRD
tara:strand:- start:202986 stop:203645 length:660 start_codon:yes stop_codon:yes gene_type:complete